jgi:hypothetical protein
MTQNHGIKGDGKKPPRLMAAVVIRPFLNFWDSWRSSIPEICVVVGTRAIGSWNPDFFVFHRILRLVPEWILIYSSLQKHSFP